MWLTNVILEGKVIENERLELKDKDALYHLGPNLTLNGCTLVLQVPAKRLLLPGPRLVNCTVETKRELTRSGRASRCSTRISGGKSLPPSRGQGMSASQWTSREARSPRWP